MNKRDVDLRFGMIAVQKGFVTPEDVHRALDIQLSEDFSIGRHRLIGRILLDERLMTPEQLSAVLSDLSSANAASPTAA